VPRDRRRHGRATARRSWAKVVLPALLIGIVVALAVGSLAEIHSQSKNYGTAIDKGYGALAVPVVDASNQTGAALAALMSTAAQLPNKAIPDTARNQIQEGLDQAVASASQEASQAANMVPPFPTGSVSNRFTKVMATRLQGATDLRRSIDRMLGMSPLLIAGAPGTSTSSTTEKGSAPLLSIPSASAAMAGAGLMFQDADASYQQLIDYIRGNRIPIRLPHSVWVPSPEAAAPLSAVSLGAAASSLSSSPALVPFHQLVITSAGLVPPAVPPATPGEEVSGGPGIAGDSCGAPSSTPAGSLPVTLPPTRTVAVEMTVTNCGTVDESAVQVTETLTPVVPAGASTPPKGTRGGQTRTHVSLRSGSSIALSLPPLPVAGGHLYELSLSLSLPPTANPAGSSQQFFISISK
jgi:hypothetical protein